MKLFHAVLLAAVMLAMPVAAQNTRTVIDDAGRTVSVPANPQRVVSQNDNRLTLPLLELGVPLVGSSGRVDAEGRPYLRTVPDLLGIDFDTSDIAFVGLYNQLDYETIAALEPDLIVTMLEDQAEQLSLIAPTLVMDPNLYPLKEGMARLAEATGTQARYDSLLQAYERKLAGVLPNFEALGDIRVSVMFSFPNGQQLTIYRDIAAVTVALEDLGLPLTDFAQQLEDRQISISAEQLQAVDADFIINFYGTTPQDGPAQVRAGLDNFMPEFCSHLHACRNNQYVFFPYASFGYAFAALDLNLDLLTTHIAGRAFVPLGQDK